MIKVVTLERDWECLERECRAWVLDEVCLLERAILAPRKAFLGVLDLFCTSPSGLRNVEKSLWIDRVLSAYILTDLVQLCVTCGLFCRQKLLFWSSLSSVLDTFSCNDIYETNVLELSTTVCARRGWQIFSVCWLPVFWCGSAVGIGGGRHALVKKKIPAPCLVIIIVLQLWRHHYSCRLWEIRCAREYWIQRIFGLPFLVRSSFFFVDLLVLAFRQRSFRGVGALQV